MTDEIHKIMSESERMARGIGTGYAATVLAIRANTLATLEVAKELAAIRRLLSEEKDPPLQTGFDLMKAISK